MKSTGMLTPSTAPTTEMMSTNFKHRLIMPISTKSSYSKAIKQTARNSSCPYFVKFDKDALLI